MMTTAIQQIKRKGRSKNMQNILTDTEYYVFRSL